jgi:formiminotetrahydrofolate cyclodeaminase
VAEQTLDGWLEALGSSAPAPGGGAAAALLASIGAALVEMVCNLTIGKPRYAEHEATMVEARAAAAGFRRTARRLADEDEAAFTAVSSAYGLPRASEEEKAARSAAIQDALGLAADVPLRTAGLAADIIALADQIEAGSNINVLSDVAVAAASARAALEAAVVNVEVNLAALKDGAQQDRLAAHLSAHVGALADADRVVATVRDRIGR